MHTAICTFDDQRTAEQAVERLVQAGFDRHDVHLEYRHADGTPVVEDANDRFDGMEREIALDRGVVSRFGHFFGRLFGKEDAHGHVGAYSRAVERGHCVVIVDASDEAQAERAQNLLHGMEAGDLNLVFRAGQRPLRDIVGERQGASDQEQDFGTARSEMAPNHNMDVREGDLFRPEGTPEPERAMASQGWGEQRKLEVVPDDRPIASPDLDTGEREDKPR
jgi:hypothetical protein